MVIWDAPFEGDPPITQDISLGAARITELKDAISERAETEHVWGPGSSATLGNHLMGSARPFLGGVGVDPTNLTAPDTPTDFTGTSSGVVLANSDSLHNGRLWIDTTVAGVPILKFWNGATLTFIPVVASGLAEVVDAGATMFVQDVQAHPIDITFPANPAVIDLGFTAAVTTPVAVGFTWRVRVNAIVHVDLEGDDAQRTWAAVRLMENAVEVDSGFVGNDLGGSDATNMQPIVIDFVNTGVAPGATLTYILEGQHNDDGGPTAVTTGLVGHNPGAGAFPTPITDGGGFAAYRSHLRAWVEPE